MTPEKAIDLLPGLQSELRRQMDNFDKHCEDIIKQWKVLGKVGGQRADHAAALLMRLKVPLSQLGSLGNNCSEQIAEMEKDPFGRKASAPAVDGRGEPIPYAVITAGDNGRYTLNGY